MRFENLITLLCWCDRNYGPEICACSFVQYYGSMLCGAQGGRRCPRKLADHDVRSSVWWCQPPNHPTEGRNRVYGAGSGATKIGWQGAGDERRRRVARLRCHGLRQSPLAVYFYCRKFTHVRVSFYYKHYCEMVRKKQHYPFASFLKQKHVMAFLTCGHLPTVDCDFFITTNW